MVHLRRGGGGAIDRAPHVCAHRRLVFRLAQHAEPVAPPHEVLRRVALHEDGALARGVDEEDEHATELARVRQLNKRRSPQRHRYPSAVYPVERLLAIRFLGERAAQRERRCVRRSVVHQINDARGPPHHRERSRRCWGLVPAWWDVAHQQLAAARETIHPPR